MKSLFPFLTKSEFNLFARLSSGVLRERERESKQLRRFVKFFFSLFLFAAPFFTVHSSVYAATYYVATTGDDTYTTTQAQNPATPWLTLTGAQTKATTGDTINVAAGTYKHATTYTNFTKTITWNAQGTVVVQSEASQTRAANFAGSGGMTMNGFTFDSEGTKTNVITIFTGLSNVTFTNCAFKNSTGVMVNLPGVSNITISSSSFDIQSGSSAILISTTAGNIFIQNNIFTLAGNGSVLSRAATTGELTFTGNTINGGGSGNLFSITGGSNVTFNNNPITLTNSVSSIILTNGGSGTFEMKNNVVNFTKTTNDAFYFNTGSNWVLNIDNNTITSTDPAMVFATLSINDQVNALVQNNTIDSLATADRGQIFVRSTGTDMGTLHIIGNTLRSRSDLFIMNIGTDTASAGSGKINGAVIENNLLYGPKYFNSAINNSNCHGIFYSQNINGILRYNTINGAGYAFVIKGTGESYTSGAVSYNKIINSTGAGAAIRIKGAQAVPIYNNTIYSDSTITSPLIYVTNYNPGVGQLGGAIVKNNILHCSNCDAFSVDAESTAGFSTDNNLIYRDTGTEVGIVNSSTYSTFGAWQGAGYDTHGSSANPLFLNVGTSDLRLQRASSAINLGTDLGFTRDFVNTSVPQGVLPDAGAYEYIPLTVTINQASGQSDPTAGSTINYTVVFSESVSDFATGDITLSGTAGATTATVTGSGTTYNVAVTGMTGSGTVIATILADKATGATGNTNAASTSSDNTVTYDITGPAISSVSSAQTSASATVTWTTNENSSSKVDYGLTDTYGSSTTETDTSPRVTSHSVVLSALTSCTTYHFRVRSTDGVANESIGSDNTFTTAGCTVGSSSSSNSSSNSSSATAPVCGDSAPTTAPNLYSAAAQGPTSILLSFTSAGDSVDHYALEFGTETGEYQYSATNIGDKNTRTYLVQSLSPNKTYYFRIRGGNGCATGAWSNEISARTRSFVSANQLDLTESELTSTTSATLPNPSTEGYKVKIKVLDTNQKPVVGAKVTMHSKVQEGITDKDGLVEFSNVEPGDHKVLIAYKNFEGEQALNLSGETKEFNLTITVQEKPFSLSPLAYGIIGVMGMIIIGLIVLVKKKRK